MQISQLDTHSFHVLPYVAGLDCSSKQSLPFHRARIRGLPDALDAIIATSDLQGIGALAPQSKCAVLLGELLAFEIARLRNRGTLPNRDRTALVLAGDLHPRADEMDVTQIWLALGEECRWVAGVAGNHDLLNSCATADAARKVLHPPDFCFLDGDVASIDGLTIGGMSGAVCGHGIWAREERDFAALLSQLASHSPDLLVSHDGPNVAGTDLAGWPCLRRALENAPPTLLIRGHDHWQSPFAYLSNGTQVLNAESRVVVLER